MLAPARKVELLEHELVRFEEVLSRFLDLADIARKVRRKAQALGSLIRDLRALLVSAFRSQRDALLRLFERFRDRLTPVSGMPAPMPPAPVEFEQLFHELPHEVREKFEKPLTRALTQAMVAGGKHLVEELGLKGQLEFNLSRDPRAAAWLKQRVEQFVDELDATTRARLEIVVADAVRRGHGFDEIAREVAAEYRRMAPERRKGRDRATLIAETEIEQAYEEVGEIIARDLAAGGVKIEKFWKTQRDDRVTKGCRANEAVGWIGLAQLFPSGHSKPKRFPGCRCTAVYRRKRGTLTAEGPDALVSALSEGIKDSDLDYLRTGFRSSSLEWQQTLYDATLAIGRPATDVALEQTPIRIEFQEQESGPFVLPNGLMGTLTLIDGRHRWVSAVAAGAEYIQAQVRYFDREQAEKISEVVTIGIRMTNAESDAARQLIASILARESTVPPIPIHRLAHSGSDG